MVDYVGEGGGALSWLSVPRKATLPILLILGACAGQLLWMYIDSVKILAWLSGLATPLCMVCATTIWAMRGRLEEVFDTDDMDSSEYVRFRRLAIKQRSRATFWSVVSALMAIMAAGPAVSNQLVGPIWQASVIMSAVSVCVAAYGYMLAYHWEGRIRHEASKRKLARKRAIEHKKMLAASSKQVLGDDSRGWIDGRTMELNRSD